MGGRHTFNDIYKKQNKKLIGATFKKAFIVNVNVSVNTADVYFAENTNNIIKNIPLSGSIAAATLQVGSRCRVDVFDETNPNDMVIAYAYGGQGLMLPQFNTGTATVGTGGLTIAHGLTKTPQIVGFIKGLTSPYHSLNASVSGGGGGSVTVADIADVYETTAADATNIYLAAVNFQNNSCVIQWYVIAY